MISPDRSEEFWPEPGLMTVMCWVLGTFDVSMLAIVIKQVMR